MAQMNKWSEAVAWVNDWHNHGERGKRWIIEGTKEQRANLEAVKRWGNSGWCDVAEYERCVTMLEQFIADHYQVTK